MYTNGEVSFFFDRELNGWERLAIDRIVEACKVGGRQIKKVRIIEEGRFIRLHTTRGFPGDEGQFEEAKRESLEVWIGKKGVIYASGLRNPRHRRVIKKNDVEKEFK